MEKNKHTHRHMHAYTHKHTHIWEIKFKRNSKLNFKRIKIKANRWHQENAKYYWKSYIPRRPVCGFFF